VCSQWLRIGVHRATSRLCPKMLSLKASWIL